MRGSVRQKLEFPRIAEARKTVRTPGSEFAVESRKAGGVLRLFSSLERDYVHVVEADPCVIRLELSIQRFRLLVEDRVVDHDVRFAVTHADGTRRYEDLCDGRSPDLVDAVSQHCEEHGLPHAWIHADDVLRQPRLSNVRMLMRARPWSVDPGMAVELRGLMADGPCRFSEIVVRLGGGAEVEMELRAAILAGIVAIDLDEPLGPSSSVRLGGGSR